VSYWARLERRGWPLQAEGPFEDIAQAKGRAENRLVGEPFFDVRPWSRGVVFVVELDGSEREVWDIRWLDLAPPEARNRKFGFVRRGEEDLKERDVGQVGG